MKKNNNKNSSARRKLAAAIAMLMISTLLLSSATYAWFTMNKEVKVTNMQVKAHAEEGLLINEVATANSDTWDEIATGNTTLKAVVMRPSSTYDLVTWWHANSKKSYDEAGIDDLSGTVSLANGDKYLDVSPSNTYDEAVVAAGEATGNVKAETHVYYKDASFGTTSTSGTYQDGEGFYVRYTYYLKSSGDSDLNVSNLQVQVKATKNTTGANASGSSPDLDPCLRVGVTMNTTSSSNTVAGTKIFAPIPGDDSGSGATNTAYYVTKDATGSTKEEVKPVVAGSVGNFTAYTTLNNTSTNITIPKVTSNGTPVYVYVWFEGEDTHCMSDNLTAALAAYDIDINFKDADLEAY